MRLIAGVLCALAVFLASQAKAGVITQIQSFDLSTPIVQGQVGTSGTNIFTRFDKSLGTLDSVDIAISGFTQVVALLPSNPINLGLGGIINQAYQYSLTLTETYFGLPFFNDPQIILTGTASGQQDTLVATYDYSHSYSFDAGTDLTGIATVATSDTLNVNIGAGAAVPPVAAVGQTDDFAAPFAGVPRPILPMLTANLLLFSGYGGAVPPSGTVTNAGNITITYNYTEAVVAVAEPSALALFAFGLGGLGLLRRRRFGG